MVTVSELLVPETWEHLGGTEYLCGTWRTKTTLYGGLERLAPGNDTRISDRHVGWDGDQLVSRTPDGSDEERVAPSDCATMEELQDRIGVPDRRFVRELLALRPELSGLVDDLEAGSRAAAERDEAERQARRDEADRLRPRYGWDGDDLVVLVDGREVTRAHAANWNVPLPADRINRLGRILKVAGYELDRETRIAMVNAHEQAPPDPIDVALRGVRAARAELETALEAARRCMMQHGSRA